MADDVIELIAEHSGLLSPAQAVDYVAVEGRGYTQAEWAQCRGVTQQAISKSVAQARDVLEVE